MIGCSQFEVKLGARLHIWV